MSERSNECPDCWQAADGEWHDCENYPRCAIAPLRAALERVTRELASTCERLLAVADERDTAQRQRDEAVEALRPFAAGYDVYIYGAPMKLCVGDLRRAAEVVEKAK